MIQYFPDADILYKKTKDNKYHISTKCLKATDSSWAKAHNIKAKAMRALLKYTWATA